MYYSVFILLVAALLGFIPATIAANKGHSFLLWWIYGAALFIIAFPHSLFVSGDAGAMEALQLANGMRKCPSCAELVKNEAVVCRFCQRDLPPVPEADAFDPTKDSASVRVMNEFGIIYDGVGYHWKDRTYPTLAQAVEMARDIPVTWGRER